MNKQTKLYKSRNHSVVHGHPNIRYEQDEQRFDHAGKLLVEEAAGAGKALPVTMDEPASSPNAICHPSQPRRHVCVRFEGGTRRGSQS